MAKPERMIQTDVGSHALSISLRWPSVPERPPSASGCAAWAQIDGRQHGGGNDFRHRATSRLAISGGVSSTGGGVKSARGAVTAQPQGRRYRRHHAHLADGIRRRKLYSEYDGCAGCGGDRESGGLQPKKWIGRPGREYDVGELPIDLVRNDAGFKAYEAWGECAQRPGRVMR
jgi:hypothetical protein